MIDITISIDGQVEIARRMDTMGHDIRDWHKPLGRISSNLLKAFDNNFASRGQMFGGWQARSKSYPWPLLEKTGRLRKSFKGDVRGDALVLSNTSPYFKYHQRGTSRLPKRTMMALREAEKQMIVRQFQGHLIDTVRRANG